MIRIDSLPDLPWTEHSGAEIARAPGLIEESVAAWQIEDLFIAGWCQPNLVGPVWLWFALTERFRPRHVRLMLQLREALPELVYTAVDTEFPAAHRFVRFFGFHSIGETLLVNGCCYTIYRRG